MRDPLPKMEKVKGDKFLETDENENKWQIFRDNESTKYNYYEFCFVIV